MLQRAEALVLPRAEAYLPECRLPAQPQPMVLTDRQRRLHCPVQIAGVTGMQPHPGEAAAKRLRLPHSGGREQRIVLAV